MFFANCCLLDTGTSCWDNAVVCLLVFCLANHRAVLQTFPQKFPQRSPTGIIPPILIASDPFLTPTTTNYPHTDTHTHTHTYTHTHYEIQVVCKGLSTALMYPTILNPTLHVRSPPNIIQKSIRSDYFATALSPFYIASAFGTFSGYHQLAILSTAEFSLTLPARSGIFSSTHSPTCAFRQCQGQNCWLQIHYSAILLQEQ